MLDLCTHDRAAAPPALQDGVAGLMPVADPPFTPLELLVIGIGRRDSLMLPETKSRLSRMWRWMFGIEAPRPFADPRLEALRTLAVALRRQRDPGAAIAAARAAAITPQQIAHIVSL